MIDRQTVEIFLSHNVAISWSDPDGSVGYMEGKAERIDDADALQMLVLDWGVSIDVADIETIESRDIIPREISRRIEDLGGTIRTEGEKLRVDGIDTVPDDLAVGIIGAKPPLMLGQVIAARLTRGLDLLLPLELAGERTSAEYVAAAQLFDDLLCQYLALQEGEISAAALRHAGSLSRKREVAS